MPKMDTGIRTQQGADLFSRVNHGQTGIHFTKAVFSSVDLTGKSTDDIRQMTDIEPQELVVDQNSTRLQTLDEPITDQQQNPETVVRAIAVNDPLTAASSGFYVRTFGLYATDDQGNTVLYGVSLDSHPAYMPQFQGQEQRLAFDWDEDTSDKANIQFTNVHTAYVTWWDFQQFSQAINSNVSNMEATLSGDESSLASSVNGTMTSADAHLTSADVNRSSLQSQINANHSAIAERQRQFSFKDIVGGADLDDVKAQGHYLISSGNKHNPGGCATMIVLNSNPNPSEPSGDDIWQVAFGEGNQVFFRVQRWNETSFESWHTVANETDIQNLSSRIDGLPNWDDMNWTRNVTAPSVANSAANSAGASAISQADSNMTWNRDSLNSRVGALPTWADITWTRGQAYNLAESAKSAAQSHADTGDYNVRTDATTYANTKADSAVTQANANMDYNRRELQDQINSTNQDILNKYRNFQFQDIVGGADLDDVKVQGRYLISSGNKHNPGGCANMIVFNSGSDPTVPAGNDIWQVALGEGNQIFFRVQRWDEKSFEGWHTVANETDIQNLSARINALPNWSDENWTRDHVAPSLADSTLSQANANMEYNRANLQGEIDSTNQDILNNYNNFQFHNIVGNYDLNNAKGQGIYLINNSNPHNPGGCSMLIVLNSNTNSQNPSGSDIWQIAVSEGNTFYYRYQAYYSNTFGDWNWLAKSNDIDNLQGQINNMPGMATNAMNQANAYTDNKTNSLQSQITYNYNQFQFKNAFGQDLNNLYAQGRYLINASSPNNPGGCSVLLVFNGATDPTNPSGNDIWQLAFSEGDSIFYRFQSWSDKQFGPWKSMTSQVQASDNEGDAQWQSNKYPGILFVYKD